MQDAAASTPVTDLDRRLEVVACVACDGPAEVTGTFSLPAHDRVEGYVRTRCIDGHVVVVPAFVLA